jgi:hypothetical protein
MRREYPPAKLRVGSLSNFVSMAWEVGLRQIAERIDYSLIKRRWWSRRGSNP